MTARRGDSQGGVLSFTYLDVLVCTMGSLVLMLVMFAERAKKVALVEACKSQPTAEATEAPQPADPDALTQRLAEVRRQQAELERARAQAQQRLHDEQQRLSHLEEHQRRLEHELAKLHLTLKQLEAAEQQQVVDQDQAEKELERLRQLIKDTEARLVKMREEGAGERSYAIVPYKGPNGTFRRPVYVECTREAIILQPEGIHLSADDFSRPLVSGNPLAAAIRAAQEELNARARTAGGAELPDPYPLFIVRPDGIKAYEVALAATRTWDSDYGYEFVDADWKLAYPDADPRLAQVMTHAIDTARQRQRLLAMAAPSRYGTRLTGTGGPGGGRGPGPGGYGGGHGGSGEQNANYNSTVAGSATIDSTGTIGDVRNDSADAMRAGGGGQSFSTPANQRYGEQVADRGNAGAGNFADQFAQGHRSGGENNGHGAAIAGATSAHAAPTTGAGGVAPGQPTAGGRQAPGAFATSGAGYSSANGTPSPGQFDPHAPATNASAQSGAAAAGGNQAASANSASGNVTFDGKPDNSSSAAKTRGVNWANKAASRRASPITRPIHVIVRPDQLTLVDVAAVPDPAALQGKVVTFHQPHEKVLDQLAAAIHEQTREWGLAGHGMYWRPTLVFQVAPGAEPHAYRLAELMQDSGIDVRLPGGPQTAARPEEPSHATR